MNFKINKKNYKIALKFLSSKLEVIGSKQTEVEMNISSMVQNNMELLSQNDLIIKELKSKM